MSTSEPVWHYIQPIGSTRLPRRHIFLDTESRTVKDKAGYAQVWRCGVARFLDAPKNSKAKWTEAVYTEPRTLWTDVDAFTRAKSRTILWAHNLSYDLRISTALEALPMAGWTVEAHNLEPAGTWISWRKDDRTLVMVDSASVFPTSMSQMSKHFGLPYDDLPPTTARLDAWVSKCRRDVAILFASITNYLEMLEREDLGPWQPTGTGQAWAGFRHRFLTERMLVHQDEDARSAERRAMWTGRCEAYWHGQTKGAPIDEWDMTLAYPRVAATHDVPVELTSRFTGRDELDLWLGRRGYEVLVEVEVYTDLELVPMEKDGRIAWPVGAFTTTLWGPEIRLLLDYGAVVNVNRGWVYRTAPALQEWAEWILGTLSGRRGTCPAWWALVVKHWGRALIGRLAMSYRAWDYLGRVAHRDVRQWVHIDADTGDRGQLVQIGNDVWVATKETEWSQAQPAITGYVMSVVRVELTQLILAAPRRSVLYADTDSIYVSSVHREAIIGLAKRGASLGLRLKSSWTHVKIMGPRQVVTGPKIRIAGIPIKARVIADDTMEGEVWQSLRGAMAAGRPTIVRVRSRRWKIRGIDARRVVGPDGWTEAHRVGAL